VAAKRGFFAELQHQNQLAANRRLQAARAANRANVAAQRQAEQARRQAERAHAQHARASAAEQKAAEREAKRLHDEAMHADANSRNAHLADTYEEIDAMLAATLLVDDFVDLEELRTVAVHPPFARSDLEVPNAPPSPFVAPPEPRYEEPESPKGLFGGKKKHAELVAQAQSAFAGAHESWQAEVAALPGRQLVQMQEHQAAEQQRLAELDQARSEYQAECDKREAEAAEANRQLDALVAGLDHNDDSAIQDYVGIVLGNSVYPESFPVSHDFEFDSRLKELSLTVLVPPPSHLPSDKEFKYVKAKDEISASMLPKNDQKERYSNAVYQVALRSVHEIFEADRAGRIGTIALNVATEDLDPATGLERRTCLVAVAAEREAFTAFDLSNIVPLATLQHLGASISKNPFELIGIDTSKGVRER
jgi:restriction system protein